MTYEALLDRIISDGIAEVREAYADPKEHHKRDGAIDGFEACRDRAPGDLVALWTEAERGAEQIVRDMREDARRSALGDRPRSDLSAASSGDATDYWRQRYKVLQIEWVCNVVSVGLVNSGQPALLGHLPTARAAMKYAAIVGVTGVGAET